MTSRRRYPRFTIEGINCNLLAATEVDIINMSLGGIALIANVRLELNEEYSLKLKVKGRELSVHGVVAWSVLGWSGRGKKGEIIPLYMAGLRFMDLQQQQKSQLIDFIDKYKIATDWRVIARFDMFSPERVSLQYPFFYKVKKISYGGILIQTEKPFKMEETLPMELLLSGYKTIRVYGRVASCLPSNSNSRLQYDVGVEFLSMTDESRVVLRQFIDELQLG